MEQHPELKSPPTQKEEQESSLEELQKIIEAQRLETRYYLSLAGELALKNKILTALLKRASQQGIELADRARLETAKELSGLINQVRREADREELQKNIEYGEDKARLQEDLDLLTKQNQKIEEQLYTSNRRLKKLEDTLQKRGVSVEGGGSAERERVQEALQKERDKLTTAFHLVLNHEREQKKKLSTEKAVFAQENKKLATRINELEATLQAQKKGMIQSEEHVRDVRALHNRLDQVQSLREELRAQKKPRPDIEITDGGDIITKLSSVSRKRPDIEITDDGDIITKLSSVSHVSKPKEQKSVFDRMIGGIKKFWKGL